MTLSEKQRFFTKLIAVLIEKAYDLGYELTFGEAYRDPRWAAQLAAMGKGIKNSLHIQRLAVDLNLFKNGQYLTDSEAYRTLGEFWESLSTGTIRCCWGGRFSRPDGNHFSVEHNGVR
jgi:hypothetical protein